MKDIAIKLILIHEEIQCGKLWITHEEPGNVFTKLQNFLEPFL